MHLHVDIRNKSGILVKRNTHFSSIDAMVDAADEVNEHKKNNNVTTVKMGIYSETFSDGTVISRLICEEADEECTYVPKQDRKDNYLLDHRS